MESFFTRTPEATWRRQERLHVHLLPPDETVAVLAAAYQEVLARRDVPHLAYQPARWLHLSVERINAHRDELAQAELGALTSVLQDHLAAVPPFTLEVGPALVGRYGITLDAIPDEPWRQVRAAVRQAAVEALGCEAVALMRGSGRPHISIAYSTGHVDIEPHLGALNHVRPGRAYLPVSCAYLVAVRQDAVAGMYTWQDVETIPLDLAQESR